MSSENDNGSTQGYAYDSENDSVESSNYLEQFRPFIKRARRVSAHRSWPEGLGSFNQSRARQGLGGWIIEEEERRQPQEFHQVEIRESIRSNDGEVGDEWARVRSLIEQGRMIPRSTQEDMIRAGYGHWLNPENGEASSQEVRGPDRPLGEGSPIVALNERGEALSTAEEWTMMNAGLGYILPEEMIEEEEEDPEEMIEEEEEDPEEPIEYEDEEDEEEINVEEFLQQEEEEEEIEQEEAFQGEEEDDEDMIEPEEEVMELSIRLRLLYTQIVVTISTYDEEDIRESFKALLDFSLKNDRDLCGLIKFFIRVVNLRNETEWFGLDVDEVAWSRILLSVLPEDPFWEPIKVKVYDRINILLFDRVVIELMLQEERRIVENCLRTATLTYGSVGNSKSRNRAFGATNAMVKTMKKGMLDELSERLRMEPIVVEARRYKSRLFAQAPKLETPLGKERKKGKKPMIMEVETVARKFKKFWKIPSMKNDKEASSSKLIKESDPGEDSVHFDMVVP